MSRQPADIGAIVFLAAVSVRSLTAQDATQFRDPMAEDFFRYSRMAVGGGAIAKIKTLAFKGSNHHVQRRQGCRRAVLRSDSDQSRDREKRLQTLTFSACPCHIRIRSVKTVL
jgi:hypothetical protein